VLARLARPLAFLLRGYARFAREITRRVVTESLMVLALPDVVLALSRNLESPCPEPFLDPAYAELRDLCSRFEPPGGACDGCGARDWADLNQRMHYILHLFRAFHFRPALMAAPFAEAQVHQLMAGRVPDGEL
jgi:hypothetical protein